MVFDQMIDDFARDVPPEELTKSMEAFLDLLIDIASIESQPEELAQAIEPSAPKVADRVRSLNSPEAIAAYINLLIAVLTFMLFVGKTFHRPPAPGVTQQITINITNVNNPPSQPQAPEGDRTSTESKQPVAVRIPGSQNFNKAQLIALGELQADLATGGFDADLPFENRSHAPAAIEAFLGVVGLYVGTRGGKRLVDKATDDIVDGLYNITKSWAIRQVAKFHKRQPENPAPTMQITIYGPDGLPLRTIEVPDENDGV